MILIEIKHLMKMKEIFLVTFLDNYLGIEPGHFQACPCALVCFNVQTVKVLFSPQQLLQTKH